MIDRGKVKYDFFTGNPIDRILLKKLWKIARLTKSKKLLNFFGSYRLHALIKQRKIACVVSVSFDSDCFLTQYCKHPQIKIISTFQGHYEFYEGTFPSYDRVVASIFGRVDAFIVQTEKHVNTLNKFNVVDKPIVTISIRSRV